MPEDVVPEPRETPKTFIDVLGGLSARCFKCARHRLTYKKSGCTRREQHILLGLANAAEQPVTPNERRSTRGVQALRTCRPYAANDLSEQLQCPLGSSVSPRSQVRPDRVSVSYTHL